MSQPVLTGKVRYRVQCGWLGGKKCIVQVQLYGYVTWCVGGNIDGEYRNWWIDALPEHLSMMEASLENIHA